MKLDFYQKLEAVILTQLSKNNINSEAALVIAPAIIADVIYQFGGSMVYLKNQTQARTDEKHKAILADFNGSNHDEICRKHGITRIWLNKLLKRNADKKMADRDATVVGGA